MSTIVAFKKTTRKPRPAKVFPPRSLHSCNTPLREVIANNRRTESLEKLVVQGLCEYLAIFTLALLLGVGRSLDKTGQPSKNLLVSSFDSGHFGAVIDNHRSLQHVLLAPKCQGCPVLSKKSEGGTK